MNEFVEKIIGKLIERSWLLEKSAFVVSYAGAHEIADEMALERYQEIGIAIDIVKRCAEEYNNGWIPCSDRLPEEEGYYLITIKFYHLHNPIVMGCNFENGEWGNIDKDDDVVAWMPLPEPYRTE